MFTANMSEFASRFNEEGINSSGSLTKPLRQPPSMSADRERAERTIMSVARSKGQKAGVVIRKVLSDPDSIAELQSFVQVRGETPANDPTQLAVQAAMLRATEIGLIAKKLDTTDTDALQAIEESEQQVIDDNAVESSGILSPDTSAALNLLVCRISDRYKQQGGSGKLSDWINKVMQYAGTGSLDKVATGSVVAKANGADDADNYYFGDDNYGSDGSGSGTSSGGSFWDNLFDGIDKVVDTVTKVSGAINTTVGNVKNTSGSILDTVTNVGGDIGANSISKYMKANWLTILIVVVVLILFTVLIIRVGRK